MSTSIISETGECEVKIDDRAFLPDDLTPVVTPRYYNSDEVKAEVEHAVKKANEECYRVTKLQVESRFSTKLDRLQKEAKASLIEQARQWEKEQNLTIVRTRTILAQQQQEQQNKFDLQINQIHEQNKVTILAIQEKMEEMDQTFHESQSKIREKAYAECSEKIKKESEIFQKAETEKRADEIEFKNQKLREDSKNELEGKHAREMESLRLEMHQQNEHIRKELVETIERYELELKSTRRNGNASFQSLKVASSKREQQMNEWQAEATIQVEKLEEEMSLLVNEVDRVQREAADGKNSFRQELEENENCYEAQIEAMKTEYAQEQKALVDQAEQSKQSIKQLNVEHDNEVMELKEKFEQNLEMGQQKIEQETNARRVSRETGKNREEELQETIVELEQKIKKDIENYDIQLEKVFKVHATEIDEMNAKFEVDRNCLIDQIEHSKSNVKELEERHKKDTTGLKEELEHELEIEKQKVRKELGDRRASRQNAKNTEKEMFEALVELEQKAEKDSENYANRVEELKKGHAVEIDEVLTQLDLLESGHKERIDELERSIDGKDTVISAVGKQLAEATHTISSLESKQEEFSSEIEMLTEKYETSQEELSAIKISSEVELQEMDKLLEDARNLRAAACEQVRNETISAAEEQFNKANEHYLTLKQEYDNEVATVARLEKEMRSVEFELDDEKAARASQEAQLEVGMAQSKAALATVEANAAEKIKEFQVKAEELKKIQHNAQEELDEAKLAKEEMSQKLQASALEKESFVKEISELNAVCEEMMVIVEGCTCKVDSNQDSN